MHRDTVQARAQRFELTLKCYGIIEIYVHSMNDLFTRLRTRRRNHVSSHRLYNDDAHGATADMTAKRNVVRSICAMKRESTTECSISN